MAELKLMLDAGRPKLLRYCVRVRRDMAPTVARTHSPVAQGRSLRLSVTPGTQHKTLLMSGAEVMHDASPTALRRLWTRWSESSPAVTDVGDRRSARLIATTLLLITPIGTLPGYPGWSRRSSRWWRAR